MAHKSRPSPATGKFAAALLAGTALFAGLGGIAQAQTQYSPYYANPLANGPVPYAALQGGPAAQPYYGQGYAPAYGQAYGQAYGGTQIVGGGGSIVYDRSVLGGGGYQAPFYAGAATGQAFQQPGQQFGNGPVPYSALQGGSAQAAAPNGVYGESGGLLVPGPTTPRSQLYIQPGVAAPGYAQTQVGIASGVLPPAPPSYATQTTPGQTTPAQTATSTAPTSTPQIASATTPLPPASPDVTPPPTPSPDASSSGPTRVPVIVEDTSPPPTPPAPPPPAQTETAEVAAPPPPPPTPPTVTQDTTEDDTETRTVEDILQPPPPPDSTTSETTELASTTPPAPPTPTSTPPAQTPDVRTETTTPPPPPPTPETPAETVSTETSTPTPPPPPTPPASSTPTDGSVALSVPFEAGSSDLPASAEAELRTIADQMNADDSLRLTIRAYAEGTAEEASQARRLSLSRALAVRSFLIEQGIRGPRMDVRALGHRIDPPRDRVDLVLVSQ